MVPYLSLLIWIRLNLGFFLAKPQLAGFSSIKQKQCVYACVCANVYIYVCIYIHIFVFVYTYTCVFPSFCRLLRETVAYHESMSSIFNTVFSTRSVESLCVF